MSLHEIGSHMELFARAYTADSGVKLVPGPNMATDGKTIWYPPIPDQYDPWARFKTETGCLHEIGHCLWTEWAIVRMQKANPMLDELGNWVEDIFVERKMGQRWPGIRGKYAKYYPRWVSEFGNLRLADPSISLVTNLMRILFYRAREADLGTSFKARVPAKLEAIWRKLLAGFLPECCAANSTKETADIALRIMAVFQNFARDPANLPPPPQSKQAQAKGPKGKKGEQQDGEGEDGGEGQDGEGKKGQKAEGKKGKDPKKPGKGKKGDDEDQDAAGEGSGGRGGDGDDEDQDAEGEGSGGQGDEDNEGSGGSEGDEDVDGEGGGASGEGEAGQPKPGESNGKPDSGKSRPSVEDVAASQKIGGELQAGQGHRTDADEAKEQINVAAQRIFSKTPGLQDRVMPLPSFQGWETVVEGHAKLGRELTGSLASRLRTLLISERAPRWNTGLQSGRLDPRIVSRVRTGNTSVFRRRIPAVYEDAAVSFVMDFTGSMNNGKISQAMALLVSLAETLDGLRVPFEALGFDVNGGEVQDCVQTKASNIWVVKKFEEPYRRVKDRFVGRAAGMTFELPAIEMAARRLAMRRETKKVLFIFTDGGTTEGDTRAVQAAIRDLIDRLLRVGYKVVAFGIGDMAAKNYCRNFIFVDDQFAAKAYGELVKLLV